VQSPSNIQRTANTFNLNIIQSEEKKYLILQKVLLFSSIIEAQFFAVATTCAVDALTAFDACESAPRFFDSRSALTYSKRNLVIWTKSLINIFLHLMLQQAALLKQLFLVNKQ
jgi:hypothetical protein